MSNTGFRRVMAAFGDFLISWSLGFLLLSQGRVLTILEQFSSFNSLESLSAKHFFVTCAVFVLLRFYFALFFKLSPIQHLWGLSLTGHNFMQVRLSACLRVFIMPLLGLIYPLDRFMQTVGKRNLSEVLTGSRLNVKAATVTLVTGGVSTVFLLVVAMYSPLFYESTFMFNPNVNFIPHEEVHIEKGRDFNLFKSYASKSFKMMTFTDLDSGRFKVQPSFEIRRKSGKLIYRPMLSLWDTTLGVKGKMKISKRFELLSLVRLFKENDPFFNFHYPELSKTLIFYEQKANDKDVVLDKLARAELFELISSALLANPYTMTELVKNGRFYSFPYVVLKRNLFKLMGGNAQQKFDFVNRGDEIFIRTLIEDEFNNELRERFFSFSELRPIVYEIIWNKSKWDKKVSASFSSAFFNKSKWGSKVLEESKIWENEYIFNPLSILDYLGYKEFSTQGRGTFESYLKKYYFQEAKDAIGQHDNYQKLFLASMQRVYIVLKLMKKQQSIPYNHLTLRSFDEIMKALRNGDKEYFGVDKNE